MIILGIDTSGSKASVALAAPDKVICEMGVNSGLTHSQTLMPMIEQLFKISGLTLEDVGLLACSAGPGAFTGLRIGASVAKGLGLGLQLKIVPVSTLEALAYNVFMEDTKIVPVMDARRSQVYAAVYQDFQCIYQPAVCEVANVLELVSNHPAVFLGDAAPIYQSEILKAGHKIAPPHLLLQNAGNVAFLAHRYAHCAVDSYEFSLTYIRQSQAERERGLVHV
ncbi:MAG: tRNA (adenosine(37)-N6)-threonylcarbamoyltransferase complex dimerization subunit type 1 TsaB [Defluviitaleaceae bacterium]|nr:tRNA (adenosine(37)-N6)-threonylcarbamoyltransferase complex dimerization subunit type 1 TsaB [Defluviitaleaceae bacterium]